MHTTYRDEVIDAVNNQYSNYIELFESLTKSQAYSFLSYRKDELSLSSSELVILLRVQEIINSDIAGSENRVDAEVSKLLRDLLSPDSSKFKYYYLFVQALISFLHRIMGYSWYRADMDSDLDEILSNTAQLSLGLAEGYAKIGTSYKDIERKEDWFDTYIEERNEKLFGLLISLSDFAKLTSRREFIDKTVATITAEYYRMDALNDEYKNLFEYFGVLVYYGNDHSLYQMAIDELESRIYCALDDLSLPDLVVAMSDDIYNVIQQDESENIDSWDKFRYFITLTDEYYDFVKQIKNDFLRSVPEYFPD
jgi:hypothetical protein